jgi:hypothetical protein
MRRKKSEIRAIIAIINREAFIRGAQVPEEE